MTSEPSLLELVRLAHIALSVSSIDKSVKFYGKYFGFRLAQRYTYRDAGLAIAIIKNKNIALELFEFKKRKPLPQYRKELDSDLKVLGVKHFCFEAADIEAAYEKFKNAKVSFATDIRVFDSGQRYFFIKDPDGILVEVMEANKKS